MIESPKITIWNSLMNGKNILILIQFHQLSYGSHTLNQCSMYSRINPKSMKMDSMIMLPFSLLISDNVYQVHSFHSKHLIRIIQLHYINSSIHSLNNSYVMPFMVEEYVHIKNNSDHHCIIFFAINIIPLTSKISINIKRNRLIMML